MGQSRPPASLDLTRRLLSCESCSLRRNLNWLGVGNSGVLGKKIVIVIWVFVRSVSSDGLLVLWAPCCRHVLPLAGVPVVVDIYNPATLGGALGMLMTTQVTDLMYDALYEVLRRGVVQR